MAEVLVVVIAALTYGYDTPRTTQKETDSPANVVVGIATMSPGYLIEVDAIAVID